MKLTLSVCWIRLYLSNSWNFGARLPIHDLSIIWVNIIQRMRCNLLVHYSILITVQCVCTTNGISPLYVPSGHAGIILVCFASHWHDVIACCTVVINATIGACLTLLLAAWFVNFSQFFTEGIATQQMISFNKIVNLIVRGNALAQPSSATAFLLFATNSQVGVFLHPEGGGCV